MSGRAPSVFRVSDLAPRGLLYVLCAWWVLAGAVRAQEPEAASAAPVEVVLAGTGPTSVNARSAALLISGQEGGNLTSALWAAPVPEIGGRSTVLIVLEVDGLPLLKHFESQRLGQHGDTSQEPLDPADPTALEVFAYAVDPDGTVRGRATQRFELDLGLQLDPARDSDQAPDPDQGFERVPSLEADSGASAVSEHAERLREAGVKVLLRLDLEPGPYQLRTLVTAGSRAFGLASLNLAVPEPEVALTIPPMVESPAGRWLIAKARGASLDAFRLPSGRLPAARRVVSTTREHELNLLTGRLPGQHGGFWSEVDSGGASTAASFSAKIRLSPPGSRFETDPDLYGTSVGLEAPARVERLGVERRGLVALRVRFDPRNLALGLWDLRVVVDTGEGLLDASPPTRVLIDDAQAEPPWPHWRPRLVEGETETIAVATRPEVAERVEVAELSQRILAVFASLAAPDSRLEVSKSSEDRLVAAGRRLASLEAAVFDPTIQDSLDVLRRAEEDAWRSLESAEVRKDRRQPSKEADDDLLTLAEVHAQAAITHLAARRGALADHAVRMATTAAQRFPSGAESASALTDLAVRLADERLVEWANSVLETAIRIAPDDPLPWFVLGGLDEIRGQYGSAVDRYQRVLSLDPGHAEARLRVAINFGRLGRERRARALLLELSEEPVASWLAALAFEELVRRELEAGRVEAARRRLQAGFARFPDHPTLLLLEARCLSLTGARSAARTLLHQIEQAAVGQVRGRGSVEDSERAAGSERDRYNRLPTVEPARRTAWLAAFDDRARRIGDSAAEILQSAHSGSTGFNFN